MSGRAGPSERILGRKSVQAMMRDQGVPSTSFGLGLFLGRGHKEIISPETAFHHGGGWVALYMDPVEQMVAVYFVPSPHPYPVESIFSPANIIWSGINA